MTEVVRLPVQDGATLTVLFLRVPADAFDAGGTLEVANRVLLPRHNGAYRHSAPVFHYLPTVKAWLDKQGWEYRESAPVRDKFGNEQHPNPFEGD